jgi:putative aminopeptidase FrvX
MIAELLQRLLTAAAPSGHEAPAARAWREGCQAFADEVGSDHVGSSFARVRGRGGGPVLALVGHIDEIGLHVTHIDEKGLLRFGAVGGWDPVQLVGQRVAIATREGTVRGVIGRKPLHLLDAEERKKAPELKALHIDIGARSEQEARERVRIGDVAVIDVEPLELIDGLVASRALDNRVGCYVAAQAAALVAQSGRAAGDVLALAVAQEETSFAGSRTSAFALQPDLAIAIDVTHASDQPGVELGQTTKHELGSGPVISRGTTLHPLISELLIDAAEAEQIPYTLESEGRATGTDADAIHVARSGIPTGLVSVPLRYMHSPVELVCLSDVEATARLLAAFARRLEPGISFAR